MKAMVCLVALMACCAGVWMGVAEAAEENLGQKWVDITEKVWVNPADSGGWTEDGAGKIFRSEDGDQLRVVTGSHGTYIVDLSSKKISRIEGETRTDLEDVQMIQRDFGTSLVIKSKSHKFRLKFKEQVSGMRHIEGIKGV
ncbi:hypothetical protein JXA80_05915 [bacterium]|nr:hypothetical protein [candidate division CSSED10-310 bacterium]